MCTTFSDAIADTREAFLDLVRNTPATFYEVYSGAPSSELESLFSEASQGEMLLRFDMQQHTKEARARFCRLSDLERRAYSFPVDTLEKPLPYFGAFVPGMGHIGIAWTSDDVRELIVRTRRDLRLLRKVGLTQPGADKPEHET
jgi:hypothetical protein